MYVIGKITYLSNRTLVQITPEDILVMSRPYGPSQVCNASTSASNLPLQSALVNLFELSKRDIFIQRSFGWIYKANTIC